MLPPMFCNGNQLRIIIPLGLGLAGEQLIEERLQISPVTIASVAKNCDNLLLRRRRFDSLEFKLGSAHTCVKDNDIAATLQTD